jgi:hypothetical protein
LAAGASYGAGDARTAQFQHDADVHAHSLSQRAPFT